MHLRPSRLCFFAIIFISFIVIVSVGNAAQEIFDDFNDGLSGSNLGGDGTAGPMSPGGTNDPTVKFSTDSHEGAYAIKFTYNIPVGGWNGYWSFTTSDITTPGTYNASAFTDIRFYAKGASGGEFFKVELVSGVGLERKLQAVYINTISDFTSGLGTDYAEIVIPFSSYSLINTSQLVQVNIVFDQGPVASSVYIDYIRFTDETPGGVSTVLTIDDFNDGVYGNNLGSGAGACDPVGYPDILKGGTSNEYINRSDLEPGPEDLVYFVSGANAYEGSYGFELTYDIQVDISKARTWVGYWTQFVAKEDDEPAKPFDLTAYNATAVRFWAKGAIGGEKFKVEMKYTGKTVSPFPTQELASLEGFEDGLDTDWKQVSMDLSAFIPALDLATASEFVIVFDQQPYEGTIYIDNIEFVVSTTTIPAPPLIAHTPIKTIGIIGNKTVIEATVQDEGSVEIVTLYYKKKTDIGEYIPFTLNPCSSSYSFKASIPVDYVTTDGVYYYITATDDDGKTAYYTASGYTPSKPDLVVPLSIAVSQTTTGIIGASGGTITVADGNSDDGNSTLTIPAGALNSSTTIVLKQEITSSAPAIGDNTLVNSTTPVEIFDFGPSGTVFNTPVTLTMLYFDYNPSDGTVDGTTINETGLRLFYWDGYDWRYVGRTSYNATSNTVTANILSFSKYALFPLKAEPNPEDYRPKEKIITPSDSIGKNDFARFNGFTGEIIIYDVTGKKIRTITGIDVWDGRDDDGNIVESGLYIYKFESNGTIVNGMIAVAK